MEGKNLPRAHHEGVKKLRMSSAHILNFDISWMCMGGFTLWPHIPRQMSLITNHCIGCLVDAKVCLGIKKILRLSETEPIFPIRPAHNVVTVLNNLSRLVEKCVAKLSG